VAKKIAPPPPFSQFLWSQPPNQSIPIFLSLADCWCVDQEEGNAGSSVLLQRRPTDVDFLLQAPPSNVPSTPETSTTRTEISIPFAACKENRPVRHGTFGVVRSNRCPALKGPTGLLILPFHGHTPPSRVSNTESNSMALSTSPDYRLTDQLERVERHVALQRSREGLADLFPQLCASSREFDRLVASI
jgi:hypothetical protein